MSHPTYFEVFLRWTSQKGPAGVAREENLKPWKAALEF
jgi:hypothetical protein